MLQKIRDFFKDRSPVSVEDQAYLGQQIDAGTKIIEMLDSARESGETIVLWIEVGMERQGVRCSGRGDEIINQLYQFVSKVRLDRIMELRDLDRRRAMPGRTFGGRGDALEKKDGL